MQPRLVWRRGVAFLVDYALVSLLAALVALPIMRSDSAGMFRLGGFVHSTTCYTVNSVGEEWRDVVEQVQPTGAVFCKRVSNIILPERNTLRLSRVEQVSDSVAKTFAMTLPAGPEGARLDRVISLDFLVWLLLLTGSAAALARGRRSPGKALLGLRIEGEGKPWRREALRLGPLLVVTVVATLVPTSVALVFSFASTLAVGGVIAVAFVLYYLLPMLRWRGAMPWDARSGFVVTRQA